MRYIFVIAVICGAVTGCATPQPMGYLRIDGKEMVGDAQLTTQFSTDKTICLGDMAKANLGGAVIPTGNVLIDAGNNAQRRNDANQVMIGCMAQRGYKFVPLKPQTQS